MEALLLEMLIARAPATLCPSEVARRCVSAPAAGTGDDAWRPWMEPVRRAARRLVAEGRVEILQGGRVVDPSICKGPIRIRLSPGGLGRR